jgi:hypothetical protein
MQLKESFQSINQIVFGLGLVLVTGLVALIGFQLNKNIKMSEKYWQGEKHTIPVIEIKTDPDNLWSDKTGIYVKGEQENYFQAGDEWEKEAEMRLFDETGKLEMEQKIGLSLHGRGMRSMPQKAFRLTAKNYQGENDLFRYSFFDEEGSKAYGSLVLRVGDSHLTMMRDMLASRLVSQVSSLEVQLGRPVVVYLNQEYWGLYWLQERYDDEYFEQKYRVQPGMLGMLEVPLGSFVNHGYAVSVDKRDKAGVERYNWLVDQVSGCRGCEGFSAINKYVDIQNMIDYFILELYMGNADWPFNNVKLWWFKVEPMKEEIISDFKYLDGRLRWLLFDLDAGFGAGIETAEKMKQAAESDPHGDLKNEDFPFRNLFDEDRFRRLYQKRLVELVQGGLEAEEVENLIDKMAEEIRPEMSRQIERWGQEKSESGYHVVSSMEEWERQVDLLKVFARSRSDSYLDWLKKYYKNNESY